MQFGAHALLDHIRQPKTWFLGGAVLFFLGLVMWGSTFLPLWAAQLKFTLFPGSNDAKVEIAQGVLPQRNDSVIAPVDSEFGIVIPRLQANVPVVPDVTPFDSTVYQEALTRGVAHAAGSAKPDQNGRVFLFAHSAGDITRARQYNAVFYLLDRLVEKDSIYLFYHGQKYRYAVTRTEVVAPTAIQYLSDQQLERELVLMTCTPAGSTDQRLLVFAKLVPNKPTP